MVKSPRNRASTKTHIIDTATPMFAEHGFANTSLSDIVARADVTTGAVYYHFGDKKGLFQAVAEGVEQFILDEITGQLPSGPPDWEAFEGGVVLALNVCARPEVQRIIFVDAPTVIGLHRWREIEKQYAFGMIRQIFAQLCRAGIINVADPDLSSQVLLGSIIEAAQAVANSPNKNRALGNAKTLILSMLRSLRTG